MRSGARGLRRVAFTAALVAAAVLIGSLLYNLSQVDDWDCEEIATFYSYDAPGLVSAIDSEQNLHMLFAGRSEEGYSGLLYGLSVGDDVEIERIIGGWSHYEGLSIAVDSDGGVHVAAVLWNDFDTRLGLYAVRQDGQWRTEMVSPPSEPTYMQTWLIGVTIGPDDLPNLFYYQSSKYPQYYDPVFVWSTISDGVWDNKTVSTGDREYSHLYSTCSDASGLVHFTSWISNSTSSEYEVAYSVCDGESINSTTLPSDYGSRQLALDSYGRPFIGLIENTTGEIRYSIASLEGDSWVMDPIGECELGWGADIGYIRVNDTGDIHAVLCRYLPSPVYGNEVLLASKIDGLWTMRQVDEFSGNRMIAWGASLAIGSDGVVRVFYFESEDNTLMRASSEKDAETQMQPYTDAIGLTLIVTVAFITLGSVAVLTANRISRDRSLEEEFKSPIDFDDDPG